MEQGQRKTQREYLIFFRGRPWSDTWPGQVRVDALARVARSVLAAQQTLHVVFDDGTTITFNPGHDCLATAPEHAYDYELGVLLANSRQEHGVAFRCGGAVVRHARGLHAATVQILTSGRERRPLFSIVLMLRETGSLLWRPVQEKTRRSLCAGSNFFSTGRLLLVLGGVKDMPWKAEQAILQVCEKIGMPLEHVSLGQIPELTSKCIKAVEAAASSGIFFAALAQTSAERWPVLSPPRGARSGQALHVVVVLDGSTPLQFFVRTTAAANLLLDTFQGSHFRYKRSLLSLVDMWGSTLTVQCPQGALLRQDDASAFWQCSLSHAQSVGLWNVYVAGSCTCGLWDVLGAASGGDLQGLTVLCADTSAPPLPVGAKAPDFANEPELEPGLAIVFGAPNASILEWTRESKKDGSPLFVSALLGNGSNDGLALAAVLHNEGMLLPAVQALAATMRPSQFQQEAKLQAIHQSVMRKFVPLSQTKSYRPHRHARRNSQQPPVARRMNAASTDLPTVDDWPPVDAWPPELSQPHRRQVCAAAAQGVSAERTPRIVGWDWEGATVHTPASFTW